MIFRGLQIDATTLMILSAPRNCIWILTSLLYHLHVPYASQFQKESQENPGTNSPGSGSFKSGKTDLNCWISALENDQKELIDIHNGGSPLEGCHTRIGYGKRTPTSISAMGFL